MKKFLATLAVVNLSIAALGGETPMMVSFKDLKWTELPERPGMQFAVLSGDPKTGEYTQIRQECDYQWRLVHRNGCCIGEGFRARVRCDDARQLGARKRLPGWKRLCVLSGWQGEVRIQARCRRGSRDEAWRVVRRRSARPTIPRPFRPKPIGLTFRPS